MLRACDSQHFNKEEGIYSAKSNIDTLLQEPVRAPRMLLTHLLPRLSLVALCLSLRSHGALGAANSDALPLRRCAYGPPPTAAAAARFLSRCGLLWMRLVSLQAAPAPSACTRVATAHRLRDCMPQPTPPPGLAPPTRVSWPMDLAPCSSGEAPRVVCLQVIQLVDCDVYSYKGEIEVQASLALPHATATHCSGHRTYLAMRDVGLLLHRVHRSCSFSAALTLRCGACRAIRLRWRAPCGASTTSSTTAS